MKKLPLPISVLSNINNNKELIKDWFPVEWTSTIYVDLSEIHFKLERLGIYFSTPRVSMSDILSYFTDIGIINVRSMGLAAFEVKQGTDEYFNNKESNI